MVGIYHHKNILEGFCANAEELCRTKDDPKFCDSFYKTTVEDNFIIFDFTKDQQIKIPHMTIDDLHKIMFSKLKLNKACDVYQLTVEHIRNAGPIAHEHILALENKIIDDINSVTCPETKTAVGSIIHKGKKKPLTHHKSCESHSTTGSYPG